MDKEDFEAWKTSQGTQWVLARLAAIAARVDQGMRDHLMGSFAATPAEWAALQANAADAAGYIRAIEEMYMLEFEDIDESTAKD